MLKELSSLYKTPKNRSFSSTKPRTNQLSYGYGSTSYQTTTKSPVIALNKTPKSGREILISQTNDYNKQSNRKRSVRNSYSSNLKEIKKENTKTFFCSIDKSAPVPTSDKSINEAENLRALEQMISSIKEKGFEKYEKEYNNKLKIKAKLEQSIETLKRKISLNINNKRFVKQENTKEKMKIENIKNVSERYKSISDSISKYQKEIPQIKPQIDLLKHDTVKINAMIIEEKRSVDLLKDRIAKINKQISDKEKEKDNFRPAMNLLKKHISALKLKIKNLDIQKSEFMLKVTEFTEKVHK